MNLLECIKMSLSSIKANKMRSLLTMLGIIIGISSVILITTIGSSVKSTVNNTFNNLGLNLFYGYLNPREFTQEIIETHTEDDEPTLQMYYDLVDKYPDQFSISYRIKADDGTVFNSSHEYLDVYVYAACSGYFQKSNRSIIEGRAITNRDDIEKRSVAVVSEKFAEKYCHGSSIINKPITIKFDNHGEEEFYVVGVYKDDTESIETGNDATRIYVPYQYFGSTDVIADYLPVFWNPEMGLDSARENFSRYFEGVYRNNKNWHVIIDDYEQELFSDIDTALSVLTIAFSLIASISLLVGGIGVMNIMLVSIVERTSEIGIRKALGAQNSSIRIQFVTEAIMICTIGCIIGIAFGLGLSYLIGFAASQMLPLLLEDASTDIISVSVKPSFSAIFISVISSVAIGVIFGFYPANRAAKMNPIDALRHE